MFRYIKNCLSAHKYSNFFMIAAFTIAVFALYTGMAMYEKMQMMIEEKSEYQYTEQVSVLVSNDTGEALNMPEFLKDCTADVKLIDYGIYVNGAKATYLSEVYFNRTEQISYPLQ